MSESFAGSRYREWTPGRWENVLPSAVDDFDQENRNRRIEWSVSHIRAGADRDICRGFLRSEEEYRSACRQAGAEPGVGWIVRPDGLRSTEHRPQPVAPVEPTRLGDDVPW